MKSVKPVIKFHFQAPGSLPERRKLKEAISRVFEANALFVNSINIIFCSDAFLLDINKEYLGHDYYTDIITFNLSDKDEPIEGEIYISIDRVKENAQAAGVEFNHELHRVIFHGILHLCGFDDKTDSQKREMTAKENRLLQEYLVSRET